MASFIRPLLKHTQNIAVTAPTPVGASTDGAPIRTRGNFLVHAGLIAVSTFCTWNLFMTYLYDANQSTGWSMYPTMPPSSAWLILSRRHARRQDVQLGDVVEAHSPIQHHGRVAKRVIGMPGDYVVRDPPYALTVGGASLPGVSDPNESRREPEMVQVPEGHVWLAGDNLGKSRDSRFYGPVPLAMLTAKSLYTGSSWFSWKKLDNTLMPVDKKEG